MTTITARGNTDNIDCSFCNPSPVSRKSAIDSNNRYIYYYHTHFYPICLH